MATKRKETAASGTKSPPAARVPRGTQAARAPADRLAVVTAERDALRAEVDTLRVRVETLTSVRGELQKRLEGVMGQIEKLLGR